MLIGGIKSNSPLLRMGPLGQIPSEDILKATKIFAAKESCEVVWSSPVRAAGIACSGALVGGAAYGPIGFILGIKQN